MTRGCEAGLFGGGGDGPEPRPQLGRADVPGERRDLQPEAQGQRIAALAGGGGRCGDQGGRHDLDLARLVHAVEPLVGQHRQRRLEGPLLAGHHLRRQGRLTPAVALPAHGGGGGEGDRVARHAVAAGDGQPRPAPGRLQAEAVDHRQEAAAQAAFEDVVEHGEGVGPRPLVVVALPHEGPQGVGRHHLAGSELSRGPRRLAGTDGPTRTTRHVDGSRTRRPAASGVAEPATGPEVEACRWPPGGGPTVAPWRSTRCAPAVERDAGPPASARAEPPAGRRGSSRRPTVETSSAEVALGRRRAGDPVAVAAVAASPWWPVVAAAPATATTTPPTTTVPPGRRPCPLPPPPPPPRAPPRTRAMPPLLCPPPPAWSSTRAPTTATCCASTSPPVMSSAGTRPSPRAWPARGR